MWQHCVLLQRLFNYLEILWSILSGATIIIPILSMLKWRNRDINFPRVKQAVMMDLGFEPSLSLHYILKGDWAKEPSCLESTFKVTLWEKRGPCQIQIWILALLYYVASEVKLLSHVRLFATPWTVAHQAPPSMKFSRQEYWSTGEEWQQWVAISFSRGSSWTKGRTQVSRIYRQTLLPSEPPGKPCGQRQGI